jgi:glycosyltransferase involved in cell wall biosynthesis
MVLHSWKRLADSEVLVFGKLIHPSAHRLILRLRKKMMLITPYRPEEMWKDQQPDSEILNSFESIISQGHTFEDDLRRFGYRGKTFILPYLPPEAESASRWPASLRLQVGYLGRLVPDKNLKYLIVSFSRLRTMGVDAQLHIFGDGPERNAIQSLTNELNLAAHIQLHGNQDRIAIPAAIDSCHLFAFSSTTEGQCLSALEILARGRRVLGTPVGAFPEFLSGLLGGIAPLDDPTAFATALKAIAKPVLEATITPTEVQQAYRDRFPRQQVIEGYLRAFGFSDVNDQGYRAL